MVTSLMSTHVPKVVESPVLEQLSHSKQRNKKFSNLRKGGDMSLLISTIMIRRLLLNTVNTPAWRSSAALRWRLGRGFSETAGNQTVSSASTFKSKNFMKEFIKYVHPDILHQAPERVREENSRSMQILNSYLDQLKRNEGSSSVELKFYTPEKTTRKNKKFFFFSAKLEAFAPKLEGQQLESLKNR